jgi:nitrite reductase/ring-hydroxylating ferredoxin subunit
MIRLFGQWAVRFNLNGTFRYMVMVRVDSTAHPLEGATMWDNLIDCPFHHFQYDVTTGENYFPRNVYPKDYERLESQVRLLKTYIVEVREGDVWVDLE